jgi:hypothetical protein
MVKSCGFRLLTISCGLHPRLFNFLPVITLRRAAIPSWQVRSCSPESWFLSKAATIREQHQRLQLRLHKPDASRIKSLRNTGKSSQRLPLAAGHPVLHEKALISQYTDCEAPFSA